MTQPQPLGARPVEVSQPSEQGRRPEGAGGHRFETGLDRTPANYVALTPASLLARAAAAAGTGIAVIDGARRLTYADLYARCRRFASGLAGRGINTQCP